MVLMPSILVYQDLLALPDLFPVEGDGSADQIEPFVRLPMLEPYDFFSCLP